MRSLCVRQRPFLCFVSDLNGAKTWIRRFFLNVTLLDRPLTNDVTDNYCQTAKTWQARRLLSLYTHIHVCAITIEWCFWFVEHHNILKALFCSIVAHVVRFALTGCCLTVGVTANLRKASLPPHKAVFHASCVHARSSQLQGCKYSLNRASPSFCSVLVQPLTAQRTNVLFGSSEIDLRGSMTSSWVHARALAIPKTTCSSDPCS